MIKSFQKEKKYWIEFYSPGSFVSNTRTVSVQSLPEPEDVVFPMNAYAFTLNERERITHSDKIYDEKPKQIGPMYYHPDSKITTLKEVKSGNTPGEIGPALISNMENNGWESIIWTRWGNSVQPFDSEKIEIIQPNL